MNTSENGINFCPNPGLEVFLRSRDSCVFWPSNGINFEHKEDCEVNYCSALILLVTHINENFLYFLEYKHFQSLVGTKQKVPS